jgi:hypothetical protein
VGPEEEVEDASLQATAVLAECTAAALKLAGRSFDVDVAGLVEGRSIVDERAGRQGRRRRGCKLSLAGFGPVGVERGRSLV